MATLRNVGTGQEVKLRGRSLIGRSQLAELKLLGKGASNEHASIIWDGAQWMLRDLTSRNGTRINDTLLVSQSWRLTVGDEIIFGDPSERWSWLDGAPPNAVAIREDGHPIEAQEGLLLLPDEDAPCASLSLRDGQWEVDFDGTTRVVEDGAEITLEGRKFRLHLPSADPASQLTRTVQRNASASAARIHFQVSPDEEHVVVSIEASSVARHLPARSFNYMLLVLARERMQDRSAGRADDESGWMFTHELARKLNTSVEALNVDVHRARRATSQLALLDDPAHIVERRRSTGQIRIGIANISI